MGWRAGVGIMVIWSGTVPPSDTKVAGVMENNLVATVCHNSDTSMTSISRFRKNVKNR